MFRNQCVSLTSRGLFLKEGGKGNWIWEAQGFWPQGALERLFSKAKDLGRRESWAVPEGEAGPAEKGRSRGGSWGAGGAVCIHQISQNLDRSQTWALGTQLCPPWPWAPGKNSRYLSDAGNGGAAESPTCLENKHFSSNGGLKT